MLQIPLPRPTETGGEVSKAQGEAVQLPLDEAPQGQNMISANIFILKFILITILSYSFQKLMKHNFIKHSFINFFLKLMKHIFKWIFFH